MKHILILFCKYIFTIHETWAWLIHLQQLSVELKQCNLRWAVWGDVHSHPAHRGISRQKIWSICCVKWVLILALMNKKIIEAAKYESKVIDGVYSGHIYKIESIKHNINRKSKLKNKFRREWWMNDGKEKSN